MKNGFLTILFSIFLFGSCHKPTFFCSKGSRDCQEGELSLDPIKEGRRVLIIGIDGFRSDALSDSSAPFLSALKDKDRIFFTRAHSVEPYTISGPNWTSLMTGVHWCKHQVKGNTFKVNRISKYPHFFKYIEEANPALFTASVVHWKPINKYLACDYADYAPLQAFSDSLVFQKGDSLLGLDSKNSPDVLFLHFDELDGAGHSTGFSSTNPNYVNTIRTIDSFIDSLFQKIETRRGNGEDWMVFVVSDHGGDQKGHGGGHSNPHINQTIFFAENPNLDFIKGHQSSQVDLVPTIFSFMGLESTEFSCKQDGISLIH